MPTATITRARTLRRQITWAEKKLWACLRNRKLLGLKFRRQQPLGPYILDFFCAEKRLSIEIDGGEHDLPERRERDANRTRYLSSQGIRTIRFWNSQIRENLEAVLARIRTELERIPSLSPCGRGPG
jgi:type I restriction enzyme M protein